MCQIPVPDKQKPPRHAVSRGPYSRLLRLVELLPGVLVLRGERFQLDVGELATDLADLAEVFVLHDVAGLGVDLDRAARAVRVLVIAEYLHGLIRIDFALLLADRMENHFHGVPAAK